MPKMTRFKGLPIVAVGRRQPDDTKHPDCRCTYSTHVNVHQHTQNLCLNLAIVRWSCIVVREAWQGGASIKAVHREKESVGHLVSSSLEQSARLRRARSIRCHGSRFAPCRLSADREILNFRSLTSDDESRPSTADAPVQPYQAQSTAYRQLQPMFRLHRQTSLETWQCQARSMVSLLLESCQMRVARQG